MRKGIVLLSGVLVLVAFLFLFPIGILTLTKSDGQIIFSRMVRPGDAIQLAYLHSVALSEVREYLVIDAEYRLVLFETRFQGQGTGLPYNAAEGEQLLREGDWFRVTGMKRVYPYIFWRVQAQWHDRFRFREDPELNLSARVGNGLIHIQAQKMSLVSWLQIGFKGQNPIH
jgi:hypothetical protein